jgi:phospholipid/cholesterol/gamma-HCH transport system ATP-binding protein
LSARAAIEIRGLTKSFGDNPVLRGVDLVIPEGATTVVLGASGSGKTVLIKHMIGLLRPDGGQVIVDGEDIAPLGQAELERVRRRFGMVFQAAALFDSMTVFENVAFPLREHTRATEEEIARVVHQKLELVALKGVDDKYPAELSGGMRKRVGLARALALDPRIVLYDEPTTGLDPITTAYVDEMILEAKRKLQVTSVVISHDIGSALRVADQIAFLDQGRILFAGPPNEARRTTDPVARRFFSGWLEREKETR